MMVLDQPYVSSFLIETLRKNNIPVLKNNAESIGNEEGLQLYSTEEFFQRFEQEKLPLLANSENALATIMEHVKGTPIQKWTTQLKNKGEFRAITKDLYPEVTFQEVQFSELEKLNPEDISYPCVLKPTVGFFSMGVYLIKDDEEWKDSVQSLKKEMKRVAGLYPEHVMDGNKFLIESHIYGEEFAVDVYFDAVGTPVILNILKHLFHGEKDTSDRVYYTGKQVIEEMLPPIMEEVDKIGKCFGLANFPVHMEFKRKPDGRLVPIEANPLRFAGWCTADIAYKAFGINSYEYFFEGKSPDWQKILKELHNDYTYLVVADTGEADRTKITAVNEEFFLQTFTEPLEYRNIDWSSYPIFAFVFARTSSYEEMTAHLKRDFSKFFFYEKVTVKQE